MNAIQKLAVLFLGVPMGVAAQVAPAAIGSPDPFMLINKLQYAVRYSESSMFSSDIDSSQSSTLSGDLFYVTRSEHRPLTIDYGGGYTWATGDASYGAGQFHRLHLSQAIEGRRLSILFGDDVSYLPQSPMTGFTGIPGIGEPIGTSDSTTSNGQSILTLNTHAVNNAASGEITDTITSRTDLGVTADYNVLRFPNGDGLDTDSTEATVQLLHRLSSRNSLMAQYQFAQYTYTGSPLTIDTHVIGVGAERLWTRNFSTSFTVGPQWLKSSYTAVTPDSNDVSAAVTATYKHGLSQAAVNYSRSTNGGAGYLYGGEVDSVQGTYTHDFAMTWTLGLSGGYYRTQALDTSDTALASGTTNATFGGVEATWRINDNLIGFVNYTGTNQSSSSALPSNAANFLLHYVGFGIGYSPRRSNLR